MLMIMGEVKLMLEAKIHKEITEYEGKIFFGMTGKQIICVLIAFAIVIPLFFLIYNSVGVEAAGYICIIVAAPIMAVGFFKWKGTGFTDLIKLMYNFYFKNKKLCCVNIINVDYIDRKENDNGKYNRKINPRYEYIETAVRYEYGSKKQLKEKRKQLRKYIATFEA